MRVTKAAVRASVLWISILLFVSLLWQFSYGFEPFADDGYDPIRYEFFARFGLPAALEGLSGYKIVALLNLVYYFFPYYWGFVLLLAFIFISAVSAFSRSDFLKFFFSPVLFFYTAQTGKDGLTCFSLLLFAATLSKANLPVRVYAILLLTVAVTLYVRYPSAIYFALILYLWLVSPVTSPRLFWGGVLALSMPVFLFASANPFLCADTVETESTGFISQYIRLLTYGDEFLPVALRFLLNWLTPFYQPVASLYRLYAVREFYFVFEASVVLLQICLIIRYCNLRLFMLYLIPVAWFLALAFPFYHGRYILVTLPAVMVLAFSAKRN